MSKHAATPEVYEEVLKETWGNTKLKDIPKFLMKYPPTPFRIRCWYYRNFMARSQSTWLLHIIFFATTLFTLHHYDCHFWSRGLRGPGDLPRPIDWTNKPHYDRLPRKSKLKYKDLDIDEHHYFERPKLNMYEHVNPYSK